MMSRTKATTQSWTKLTPLANRLLGITVLLSQLPLLLHLPIWLSLPGSGLVLAKLMATPDKPFAPPPAITIVIVLCSAVAVFFHFGHLFGRDPCVAFLFLLLGFKYVETRRAYDASLLIVLCAFLLLTQFFFQQTLTAAILSIPAMYFIGLSLFALQRGTAKTDTRTMVHITATLFLQAMPVAALLFVAVPRISQSPWNGNGQGKAQTGLSARMSPGSVAELSKSSEVAFRVEFNGQQPSSRDLYWRGPVLTGYDGYEWFILPSKNSVQATPEANGRKVEYTVTSSASYQPWLVALDTPAGFPQAINNDKISISINQEMQINTEKPVDQPLRYSATSILSDRFVPDSPPGSAALLTTATNPRTRQFANEMRAQYPDDTEFANQLLDWFNTKPFHYTLNPPKLGPDSIDDFNFDTRRGFCEHYAASFVFMLRAAGIPARVVTGYLGGESNSGYMIVRQSDAHAWTEAFIQGQWRRFDPTAAVAPERVEQGVIEALRSDTSRSFFDRANIPVLNSIRLKWDKVNFAWQKLVIDFDTNKQKALWNKLGIEKPSGWMIVLALIAAAMLWALVILGPLFEQKQKPIRPCEKYWHRLLKKLEANGLAKESSETATNYIERAVNKWPQYQQPLSQIANNYQSGMYAELGSDAHHHQQMARKMKKALDEIKHLR